MIREITDKFLFENIDQFSYGIKILSNFQNIIDKFFLNIIDKCNKTHIHLIDVINNIKKYMVDEYKSSIFTTTINRIQSFLLFKCLHLTQYNDKTVMLLPENNFSCEYILLNCIKCKNNLFRNAINLKHIKLKNIQCISSQMFLNCFSLKYVFIPKTVKVIQEGAFCNCINLRVCYIPKTVEKIEVGAFCNCFSLKKIQFYETE